MRASLSRRLMLGGLAGSALWHGGHAGADAPAHTPGADAPAHTPGADAPAHTLTVGSWGGAYAAALQAVVDEKLAAEASLGVEQVTSGEQERVARVVTPGSRPRLDVALLSDVDAYRLSLRQLFVPVTTAGVSDLPHVLPALRVPYGVPQGFTAMCVVYDPAKLHAAPRGFTALFDAARNGQAGFSSELAVHNLAAAAITQRGAPASLEAAKSIFTALKKVGSLRIYPDNEALGRALASGEIAMAPMWRSRAYVWRQAGRELSCSTPVEGAIPFVVMGCVPQGGRQTPAAMLYLDRLLHPDTQTEMARRLGLLPTTDTANIDGKLLGQIGFTAAQRARFRPLSLDAVARNGVSLRQFWNRELA